MTAVISVALTIAAPAMNASAQATPGSGPGPWGMMHDGWFGWGPLGGLIWLLVLGLAIVGVVTVVRSLSGARKGESSGALKALDERYAKGEIDRDEYLQKKRDLGG